MACAGKKKTVQSMASSSTAENGAKSTADANSASRGAVGSQDAVDVVADTQDATSRTKQKPSRKRMGAKPKKRPRPQVQNSSSFRSAADPDHPPTTTSGNGKPPAKHRIRLAAGLSRPTSALPLAI